MTVLQTIRDKAVVRMRARRVFVLGAVLASLLLVALPRALALDPDRRISQHAHTAWRVRDGAFAGTPSAITQTTDGYVWIGTLAGLVRFDGVRFVPFAPPAGQRLANPAVISLLGATDGSLWIGTASGLVQWKNGELLTFPETAGRVNSIYEDRDGTIWMARSRTDAGGVCKVTMSVAKCYGPKDGAPPYAGPLIGDNFGYLWIGTSTALVRWKPDSSTSYELSGLRSEVALAGINALAATPDGSVWAGISNSGRGLGLQQWVNGSWKTLITPTFDSSALRVVSMHLDRRNALWIGTYEAGVYRVHDGKVDHFASADGLSSDTVGGFFEDREGNLWVATAGGVDCFRDIPVVSFSVHEGLSADDVGSVFAARDGTVWIGNHRDLDFVRGNVVSSIGPKHGLPSHFTSLFEDHLGRLWAGGDNGLYVYEHGRLTPVHGPDGGPVGIVLAMAEDIDQNVWASVIRTPPGRPTKLACFRDGGFIKEISAQGQDVVSLAADPKSGLWLGLVKGGLARYQNDQVQIFPFKDASARVNQVLANSDGSVLAATDHGLVEQRGDSQHTLDGNNGLPCNRIYALVTDRRSDLWLYAECGLVEIRSDDLQHWREHPDLKVKFDLFDTFDGAQPYLPPFRPVATRSNDGRLWFANSTVAQMIDPEGLVRNAIPPPVHIEDVVADRKAYSSQNGLHLPALTRDLEIDYTALSFVVPQKVHFQYKLEGYDRDWQDAGSRRQAFYSNLPPRNYTFRVKASNNSGVWNEAGASLNFFVAPAYYQTVWFRSLAVLLLLGVLTGLFRLRVRHLERQRDALRKTEQELRDVIDTIPAIVWSALPDGSNTYVNKRFVKYSGLSQEQTAGSGWQGAIHPDDLERQVGKWMAALASGKPFENEVRFRRSDGQYRWHLDRGVPLRDEAGNIVQWYGVVTDIEDHKRAEEARQLLSRDLQESKTKLEEAQRITHVGYWEWDILTGRVNWSDETYRIFGMQTQERPMDIAACQGKIYPEDWQRGMDEALGGGAHFNAECRVIRPTGEVRIAHFQGDVRRDASGRPAQMFGTVQDITDRKLAEEELRRSQFYLSEGQRLAHMGSWAFNPSGFFDFWSLELFKIYGLDPEKGSPTLERYLATVHPQDRDFMAETVKTMCEQHSGCDVKKRIIRPDGAVRYVRCVGIPVLDNGVLKKFLGTAMDVTEQELLTQELQRREAYLAEAQRLTHTGSWAINVRTDEHFWSEEMFRINEIDPKLKPSWSLISDRVHPDDRASLEQRKKMEFTQTGWTDSEADLRIVLPDGRIKHLHTIAHPVRDASGQIVEVVGTTMDVTERKRIEDSLRRSESHLAEAQRVAHTGSWAWRLPDRKTVHLSEEWYRICGFEPAQGALILEEYSKRIHPEDLPKWEGVIGRAIAEKADYDQEFRILLPNGKVKWIQGVGHPVLSDAGDLEGFMGTSTDITERKHAEEALRSSRAYLAEAQSLTHTGSCAIDGATREAVYWSDEMFRLFGFDPQQGLPTFNQWLQGIHPEDRDKVKLASEKTFLTKVNCDVEFRIVNRDGTVKHIHGIGHPFLSATGELVQVLGTMVDVTERKRAEQEREKLRQLEADLAHTNRVSTLGEMAASLAHEIKQPIAAAITSANSCIEWLAHEPPNLDRARTAAARIDKYGNRAAEIIDRIRSFYRKSPPQRELVDANGIIQEMLTLLKGEADRSSVAMRTDLSGELPTIVADRVQLQQVFMNLMLNAIEAMQESGGELTVKSHLQDGQLQFSVSDTGVGLPAEKMDQIFSAFFTTKPQGSGMGLAISRSIVESHGGRLWATTNDGRGAAFHFTLPTEAGEPAHHVA